MTMLATVDECRGDGAFAIRNEADAFDADFGAVIEKPHDDFLVDDAAVVLLEHRVAVMAAIIARARERHINRDRRDALAVLPVAHAFVVPGDFSSVENQLLNMFSHATHLFSFSRCSMVRRNLLKSFFS